MQTLIQVLDMKKSSKWKNPHIHQNIGLLLNTSDHKTYSLALPLRLLMSTYFLSSCGRLQIEMWIAIPVWLNLAKTFKLFWGAKGKYMPTIHVTEGNCLKITFFIRVPNILNKEEMNLFICNSSLSLLFFYLSE